MTYTFRTVKIKKNYLIMLCYVGAIMINLITNYVCISINFFRTPNYEKIR